ncbi:hypothetical protein ACLKA6_007373 [Drosophila palustris]
MVNIIAVLIKLLCGLTLISAMNAEMHNKEFMELHKLQSLGLEFTQQFQNITVTDLQIPIGSNPSVQDLRCLADMALWMKGISSGSLWSLKMIDSWGSKPAGILSLNFNDLGNYEECININKLVSSNHVVRGKYCLARLPFVKMMGIDLPVISSFKLKIAVCFPSSCSTVHMDTFLHRAIQSLLNVSYTGSLVNEDSCKTSEREPLTGLTIFTIVLLSIFGALALLATLYDYFICQDQTQLPALIEFFSVRANSRALFRLTNPNSNPNVIDCLHGMRCMSLIWVVLGHDYMVSRHLPNLNRASFLHWIATPFANMIEHAVFAVDTFFFLSGLLVIMIALRSMNKSKGKLNVPLMYMHRYLRLAPLLAVAILVYMKLLPLLVDGPLSHIGYDDYKKCERTWFWTLLFVQNYATVDICLAHSWYLGVDMQLYLISPILLIALYKWGKKAAIGIVVLIVLLSVWLFTFMMVKKLSMMDPNPPRSQRFLYFSTHLHGTPWLIGAVFGYFLHVNRGKSFKLNRLVVWTGWLVSLALLFTCLFSLVAYGKFNGPRISLLEESLYYTLSRLAWPLSLCWVVFACSQGYGGMANSFLSSPLWQPLSKLSYSAYVWHILIQEINIRRVQSNTYFSNYEVMLKFWSDFGFTLLVAYATYVSIEAPLGGLERLVFSSRRPNPPAKTVPEIESVKTPISNLEPDLEASTATTISTPARIE